MIKEQIKLNEIIDRRVPQSPWHRLILDAPMYSEVKILDMVYEISRKYPDMKVYSHCVENKEITIGQGYVRQGAVAIDWTWNYVECGPTEPGAIEYPIVKIECFLNVFLQ